MSIVDQPYAAPKARPRIVKRRGSGPLAYWAVVETLALGQNEGATAPSPQFSLSARGPPTLNPLLPPLVAGRFRPFPAVSGAQGFGDSEGDGGDELCLGEGDDGDERCLDKFVPTDSYDSHYKSSGNVAMYDAAADVSSNHGYIGIPPQQGSGQVEEKVDDSDKFNRMLLEAREETIKALKEVNAQLQQEKDLLIDEKADLVNQNLELKEERDKLIQERDQLKKERKQPRAERNELQSMKAHFLKEGQDNRHKIRQIKAILDHV